MQPCFWTHFYVTSEAVEGIYYMGNIFPLSRVFLDLKNRQIHSCISFNIFRRRIVFLTQIPDANGFEYALREDFVHQLFGPLFSQPSTTRHVDPEQEAALLPPARAIYTVSASSSLAHPHLEYNQPGVREGPNPYRLSPPHSRAVVLKSNEVSPLHLVLCSEPEQDSTSGQAIVLGSRLSLEDFMSLKNFCLELFLQVTHNISGNAEGQRYLL